MRAVEISVSTTRVSSLLRGLDAKGVRLWSEQGRLRYKAPRGALTSEDIKRLQSARDSILALLGERGEQGSEAPAECVSADTVYPLTYSQKARWVSYQTGERRAMRQVATATWLNGPLHYEHLQSALLKVVDRHEALRTRIIADDEEPVQKVDVSCDSTVRLVDLSDVPRDQLHGAIQRCCEEAILEPVDFAAGPLFRVHVVRCSEQEHILIVALEHMISDMSSLRIMVRELLECYQAAVEGRPATLPPLAMQFGEYARWQRCVESSWLATHMPYWRKRFAGAERLRFRGETALPIAGWGTVPLRIDAALKSGLQAWCRQRSTTLVMGVLTAYIAAVLEWCHASESVFQFQSDSRVSPNMTHAIGFFASTLYLRVRRRPSDTFDELLHQVVDEYCSAYEHADFSYLAAQVPPPDYTKNTTFNWIPHVTNGSSTADRTSPLAHTMLRYLEVDQEPGVLLFDGNAEVGGCVYFPQSRYSAESMENFSRCFISMMCRMVASPHCSAVRPRLTPTSQVGGDA
jgi:hypothetical protein